MGPGDTAVGEGLVETFEVVLHRRLVEMVNHIAGAARGGALHLLAGATDVLGDHEPGAGEAEHLKLTVADVAGEVEAATFVCFHVDGIDHHMA